MAIDLYYMLESPPCRTVLMVAKHLNIELNLKNVDLDKGEHLKEEFVKLNPCHCVPTIVDNGFVLWESRAIVTYLINTYSPSSTLYPTDPKKRATVDRLLQYDLGTLYKSISDYIFPLFFGGKLEEQNNVKLKETLNLFDKMMAESAYVCGNYLSVADISILASLSLLESIDYPFTDWPNINKWLSNTKKELPYYEEISTKAVDNTRDYLKNLMNK